MGCSAADTWPAQTNWAICRVNGIHGSGVRSALSVLFCAWDGTCSTGSAARGVGVNKQHFSTLFELLKEQLMFHPAGTVDLSFKQPLALYRSVVSLSLYLEPLE